MRCSLRPLARLLSVYLVGISYIFFTVLSVDLRDVVAQSKSVVIAVEDDAAPWSRADGSGYANDVVIAAFKAVGVDVELLVVPYARCKRKAISGEVVGCFSASPSPEFGGSLELSTKPLFSVRSGYFYNVNKPPVARHQQNLPPKTVVGTVIGYEYPESFEALKRAAIVVVEESPSEDINLKKLAAGRIDLALLNYNEMKSPEFLIKHAGVYGQVKTTFLAGSMNSYIAFSMKHPQGKSSLKQFNEGFARIRSDGTLRRIRQTWLRMLRD